MKLSRRIKAVFMGVMISAGLSTLAYGGLYGWIQRDAHAKAEAIYKVYPQAQDEVEAVILRMQSPSCTMKERNEAVWILGRLSDKKALPALEQVYSDRPCEHEAFLCQHELKKAIRRCGGHVENLAATENP